MENSNEESQGKLTLMTVILTVLVFLGWSVGLIWLGIGQLSQQSKIQPLGIAKNIPDFAHVPNVATGVFNYGGSIAWASLRLAVDSVIQSERPELQLRYVQPQNQPPGSSPGIQMLLEGQLAFVQSSHSLLPKEYELATQKGIKLKQVPVAVNSIAVAVHPRLDISGLTLSQLQAIYTGKISNWQEVGGPDLAITAYSRPHSAGGMVDFFYSKILQNQEFGSNIEFISTTTQALRQLANNPGGIYYGSAPALVPQCTVKPLSLGLEGGDFIAPYRKPLVSPSDCPQRRNELNIKAMHTAQYPLTHYLYVVFIQNEGNEGEESPIGQSYANFLLTPQGQRLITKSGFIPLD